MILRLGSIALLCLATLARASHDVDVTDDEAKCQAGTTLAVSKFIGDKTKCFLKCEQGARKGLHPATDCIPPFAGATLACVQSAESKSQTLQLAKCLKDCPECYSGGDCTVDAAAVVSTAEGNIDALRSLVYCDDSGSGDGLTKAEARCTDTTARVLANFARRKLGCYAKCRKAEHAATVPVGSCTPPASEPDTVACVLKEETKATALIDRACNAVLNAKAERPECHAIFDGITWVALVEAAVDLGESALYCGG